MDDIYGDLCNYEDVNVLQELRDENKELKVKLEENSAAMKKLQKEILQDYDTLEVEFQKLQNNYSSLLMTARSEIQRKTQRITQLNTEKDCMVLNALKSGKNIRRDFNQGVKNPGRMNYDIASGKGNNKNKENYVKQKNDNIKLERRETPVLPPKDADTDSRNRNKSDNVGVKVELSNIRKSSVYENIAQQKHKTELSDTPKTSASSIKDRRKSMPAVSIPHDGFSSDDELERNYKTKDTRTDHLQSDNGRRNINKMPTDRYSNKTSETSSVDDRGHNNSESTSRDNYKGRSSRHHDSTTYRGRDKYEISLKYRKQYSPERGQKRQYREHQDDYHRYEHGRYQGRSLESPPPESYNRYQRQKPDFRSDYDRYSHDHEKSRQHHESKYSSKYRSKVYDEPHTKRQRIDSYSKPDAHFKEGWSHNHERESIDAQPTPNFSPHEYDMLRFSCQSPDSVYTDAALANPIKEIMATATTPLEDPRVTSKRYFIWKENGIETLSTAVGRNIDIIPVNKAVWDIKPVDIPVALVRPPSQCSDTLIHDIYMDIDNPVTNPSMETGEVRVTDDEIHVTRNTPKEIQHDTQDFKIKKQVPEDILKQATDIERVSKPYIAKYRIPKNGQDNKNTHCKMDVPVIDVDENGLQPKNVYRKGSVEDSFSKELLTHKQQYNGREERANVNVKDPYNKNYSKIEGNKKSRSRERGDHQNQATLTKIAIVADDLELSDDNSDHMDTNRKVVSDKFQKKCEMPLNINEARTDDSVNSVVNKTLISSHNIEIERAVDTAEKKDVAEDEKTKVSDSTKKQKTKKKKSKSKVTSKDSVETTADAIHVPEKKPKSKVISKDSVETTADAIHVPEKKPKSKKEKESKPKETKEKFSDLFGDSNSLVTPEDLGIPSYLPISEDAQDAVDMKINQIIDAAQLIDKDEIPSDTQTQNRVEVKIQETKGHDNIPKAVLQISSTDGQDKEVANEIKKKKSSKRNEEIIDPNELPSPIVYETLNTGPSLNDPNVVKTVIISTGIQPEIAYENKIEVTKPATNVGISAIQNIKDIHLTPATKEFKRDILKALATSTPHKEFSVVNPLQADAAKSDVICDPCVSKAVATITNAEPVVKQTEKNTLEFNDAPDVRIFVKRRRKVVKRPPMT